MKKSDRQYARLIESDEFPIEFVSKLAEAESWRKEVHRPIYHVHKWWAKRLGSVFRAAVLGSLLPPKSDLAVKFYERHQFGGAALFDPFMGSGTTIGEAHKLGLSTIGYDINPVATESVRVALSVIDREELISAFEHLKRSIGAQLGQMYTSVDSQGRPCDVLYFFWVMQAQCTACDAPVDLFSSYIIAKNAYPNRKPEAQALCPSCGSIFSCRHDAQSTSCEACGYSFDPQRGPARGAGARCTCGHSFSILDSVSARTGRPDFRLYGKLVLTCDGRKEYLAATQNDLARFESAGIELREQEQAAAIQLPTLALQYGYNTRQAMRYGFSAWRDFFNDRQLLALGRLHFAIAALPDTNVRDAFLALFSGVLEFNNLFASYKGEGTGAVRHMFSHHILKPERTPIEANPWGTQKSSGSFSTLFRSRLLRALDYRQAPTEVALVRTKEPQVCSPPFGDDVHIGVPDSAAMAPGAIYLQCGDSAQTDIRARSIDLVVTDPPFFDNVHYSELADFFYAWQQLTPRGFISHRSTTRHTDEVQDTEAAEFIRKLTGVFREAFRVLKDDGLLVFSYHHSREEGWTSLARAVLDAGFVIVNSQPVKSEMSVATPKSKTKEPIQLDIVLVCRKKGFAPDAPSKDEAVQSASEKIRRLAASGFVLSKNDRRIVVYGQLLTAIGDGLQAQEIAAVVESIVGEVIPVADRPLTRPQQISAF